MKLLRFACCVFFMFVLSLILGCSRGAHPDGMPRLTRCVLSVTHEGKPAEGVSVTLVPQKPGMEKWPSAGVTDASGEARIVTYGQFPGVPEGTFKVVLVKTATEGGGGGSDFGPPTQLKPTRFYSLIDLKYTRAETTPLELTVERGSVNQTFEIGPEVRILTETFVPGKSV